MNKDRRRALTEIKSQIEDLRDAVLELQSEEQGYLGAMPEAFQQGQKGEDAEANIEQMGAIVDAMEEAATEFDILLHN